MADNKTKPTEMSVSAHLDALERPEQAEDCRALVAMMQRLTGAAPKMWGATIVGFGAYHYTYATGREGDAPVLGFAARGRDISIYLMGQIADREAKYARLGPHKAGKACLYVKRLKDIDLSVLEALMVESTDYLKATYPTRF